VRDHRSFPFLLVSYFFTSVDFRYFHHEVLVLLLGDIILVYAPGTKLL
jgi:hypothetical protein